MSIAYIDGANLHKGIATLGWSLDYARLRVWLKQKYQVETAYIFLGLIPKYSDLYTALSKAGYTVVFKEVIYSSDGSVKGNCDADLIVQAMRDAFEKNSEQSILISSDGDYAPLVKFWIEKKQSCIVLSPATSKKCSILLKRSGVKIAYLNDQKQLLARPN